MDKAYIELLKRMVATPSTTFNEQAVKDVIVEFIRSRGMECGCEGNNILALGRDFDPQRPTLLLCAHMDTVPANSGYEFDAFSPDYNAAAKILGLENGSFVAGLGSNDDGGSVVSMIAAFEHYYKGGAPVNILLCITCEEENSGPGGSRYMWQEYWNTESSCSEGRKWPRPDFAIIGEPTSGKAATSERGLLVIDGIAHGVSGHAAREEGVNALYIALEDIEKIRAVQFTKVSPVMGKVKLSVTQIHAGTAHNVIPDSCSFVVDIRPTDCYDNTEILEMLQRECRSQLKARNLANRSSASAPDGVMMRALKAAGIEGFSSPTTSDWMRTRCDAVKMGPGESTRSHRPNEYILVSEVEQALDNYIKLIDNIEI